MTTTGAKLFGRGLAFPPRVGADGRVACSEGGENVRDAIRIILLTEPNERLMLPTFGAGLKRYLFQPNTVETRRLIEEDIRNAIKRWEPRVSLDGVRVEADSSDVRCALATIAYRLVATQAAERMSLRLQLEGGA